MYLRRIVFLKEKKQNRWASMKKISIKMILDRWSEENTSRLKPAITREEAFALVEKYNKEPVNIQHAETVEATTR